MTGLKEVVTFLSAAELSSQVYWRYPFTALVGPKQLTEFMVMDVERIAEKDKPHHRVPSSHKVSWNSACWFAVGVIHLKWQWVLWQLWSTFVIPCLSTKASGERLFFVRWPICSELCSAFSFNISWRPVCSKTVCKLPVHNPIKNCKLPVHNPIKNCL